MLTCSILLNLQKVLLGVTPDLLKELLFRSCTVRQIHHRKKAATDSLFEVTSWLWMSYDIVLLKEQVAKYLKKTYWTKYEAMK